MRSKAKDAKTGRGAPGLAALVSAGVLACFAFVLVGASPSGAHAQRPHGVDLKVRSLVAPAVVSGASFRLVLTVANKGDRTSRRSKVRAFLSQDTRRGRGDVRLLAAKSIPPLAPGARARETVTARIPRRTDTGHWFLIVCAAAGRDANSQNDCRRSSRRTTVWNYPDASNTGPTGSLRESTGNITVSRRGAVIANRKINGCIIVQAPNVTIRNSELRCSGWVINTVNGNPAGLVVEDVLIECGHTAEDAGITNKDYTLRRVEIFGCENNAWCDRNCLIVDSYIHDPIPCCGLSDPHTDSVQLRGGASNITVRHNTIYGGYLSQSNFGNSAFTTGGSSTNILFEDNLLAGGGHTARCEGSGANSNYRVRNNRFSRVFVSTVGGFGPVSGCNGSGGWPGITEFSGNVYHETGQPINPG